jgi:hypothetical protein
MVGAHQFIIQRNVVELNGEDTQSTICAHKRLIGKITVVIFCCYFTRQGIFADRLFSLTLSSSLPLWPLVWSNYSW